MGKPSARFWRSRAAGGEEGQAVVEYILMVLLAISAVSIIGIGFRRTLFSVWGKMAKEVTAACPGCPPNPAIRFPNQRH
jgi:hypothetical protein